MLRQLSRSLSSRVMAKPKLPINPYSKFVKENYKLVMAEFPKHSSQNLQKELKSRYENLDEVTTMDMKNSYKLAMKAYNLDLKNFHEICSEKSGKAKPLPPSPPIKTGYSVYNEERLHEVLATLPVDYAPIDLFKAQAEMWKNETEETKQRYNNLVSDDWAKYSNDFKAYKMEMETFESFGEPKKPKNAITAYSIYAKDVKEDVVKKNPHFTHIEVNKKIGELWRNETESVKNYYQSQVKDDKIRFDREFSAYKKAKAEFDRSMETAGQVPPSKPKTNHYAVFIDEKLPEVQMKNPGLLPADYLMMLADIWRGMTKEERMYYKNLHTEKELDYMKKSRRFEEKMADGMKVVNW